MGNIDCGSREACSIEDQKEAPQENASFFQNRLMTSIPSRPVKRGIDQLLENIRAIQDQWQIDPTTMYNVGQWMACLAHPASCMARDSRTSGAEEVHSELNWRIRIKLPEVCFKHIVRPLCRRCVPSNYAGCEA